MPIPTRILSNNLYAKLEARGVPIISLKDACKGCEDEDVEDYPKNFDMDTTSELIGNTKPFQRLVFIATGKSDWSHDINDDPDNFCSLLSKAYEKRSSNTGSRFLKQLQNLTFGSNNLSTDGPDIPGVFEKPPPTEKPIEKLAIYNGSHHNFSDSDEDSTVFIFPDFTIIKDIPSTPEGASLLTSSYLDPLLPRLGDPSSSSFKSWPLPYYAVILICSHKRRDKRCAVAAKPLTEQFVRHLEANDLDVDTVGNPALDDLPVESWPADQKENLFEKAFNTSKVNASTVGLFNISHIGGHKFAGNVVIHFPSGANIWYGRVRPADVRAIVEHTLLKGKVIPELLRGGTGISRKNKNERGVLQW